MTQIVPRLLLALGLGLAAPACESDRSATQAVEAAERSYRALWGEPMPDAVREDFVARLECVSKGLKDRGISPRKDLLCLVKILDALSGCGGDDADALPTCTDRAFTICLLSKEYMALSFEACGQDGSIVALPPAPSID